MPENLMMMIESASLMLLPVLLIAAIGRHFDRRPLRRDILLGTVFAAIGVLVMVNAVEIVPGIRTDPRAAVIVLAALFGGPLSLAISAVAITAFRFEQGGTGMVPGVSYILGTAIVSALFLVWMRHSRREHTGMEQVLIAAGIASLAPPAILFFVSQAPWPVYLTSNALATPTNFLAVMLVGAFLVRDRERSVAINRQIEKQAQINAIAENAPAVIFQIARNGAGKPQFTYVSRASERILGRAPDWFMVNDRLPMLSLTEEDTATIAAKFETEGDAEESWSLEFQYSHPKGIRWLRIDAGARLDLEGHLIWDGTMIDVTEQHAAEEMKDSFISMISHELRTPLTSIRGALGLALGGSQGAFPAPVENMLRIANRNAERLVRLVNEILDSQKIRAGQMNFDLEAQSLRPLVENAIKVIGDFAPEKNLRLILRDHAGDVPVAVDAGYLPLIVDNLLSNAQKFSPPDSAIVVTTRIVEGRYRLSVADSGPGIPASFHEFVFDRFRQAQTAQNRNAGGTGLGLNIARSFVEAMAGRIWFDTAEGEGTTFHVEFPLAADGAVAEDAGEESFAGRTPSGDRDLHLLYVEDDDSLQQIMRERVGAHARISAATTLQEARETCRTDPVDVVVLDLELPDGSAVEFINRIPAATPLVIYTAFEVTADAIDRPASVLVKSRVPESAVVETVLAALAAARDGETRDVA